MPTVKGNRAGEAAPIAPNKDSTTNSGGAGRMVGREPRQQCNKATTSTQLNEITTLLHGRIGQIATELHGAPTASTATTQRHSENQGLLINLAEQDWHDFRSGRGGDAFSLIICAKGYTQDEAVEWVREFVERTPDSPAVPTAPERDDPAVYTANKGTLSRAVSIAGTPAEDYLRGRGIELPASSDDHLLWLDDARTGESAMVAVATDDNDKPVAFQLTYLQNDRKSSRQPVRRTYKLRPDWSVRGVMRVGAVDNAEQAAVTEGTEDGLSVHIATGLPVCVAWGASAIRAPGLIRKLIILPDYDPPRADGEPHQTTKLVEQAIDAQLLSGDRSEVSLAAIPPGTDGGKNDANAILIRDGRAALAAIVNAASPQTLTFAGWAEKIASKPLEDRGDLRRRALDAIKARYGTGAYTADQFDRLVKSAESRRRSTAPDDEESVSLVPDPVPHPEPVTTSQVIKMISDNIKRFVVMDDADRLIAAYYVLLTFVYDRLDICPKLLITAPVMQAGKSRLASTLGHMSCRPLFFANMSPAVMYRVVEEVQPTMIIAEADAWLKDNEELRGLINAGHERDEAFAWRMVKDADGNMTATKFSVFGPQIISGIGTPHGTMMSRAFVIRMQPKRADQQIDRLRSRNKGTLVAAQRYAARWAVDFGDKLQSIETPVMPEHWRDRQQDNAEVLLTLATIGGVEMVNNLRTALNLSYARENKKQLPTPATQLLTDIYDCYVARGQAHNNGKLHNEEIIEQLLKMEEAPWATFERGQPLGRPKMGRMLKDFNVRSIQIKRSGKNKRGMTFDEINRAVETFAPAHLAPDTAVLGATPLPSAETLGKTGSTTALEKLPGTAGCYPENLQNSAEGSRVAPFEPETGCAPGGGGLSVVGNNPANESCLVEGDPLALPDFRRSRGSGDARNGDESDLDEVM